MTSPAPSVLPPKVHEPPPSWFSVNDTLAPLYGQALCDALPDAHLIVMPDGEQYKNLNTVANPVIMTGPGFVTPENAAQVKDLSAAGTR